MQLALGALCAVGLVSATPTGSSQGTSSTRPSTVATGSAAWQRANPAPNPQATDLAFLESDSEYITPQPPGRDGQFHVIWGNNTSKTDTILFVYDSVSDFNGPDRIKHSE